MIKGLYIFIIILCPLFVFGQNVGIGTLIPESLLHLYSTGTNGAGSRLIFGDDLLNGRTNAYIGEWGWQTNSDSDILEVSGHNGIKFTTGSSSANTRMEITGDGDILVTGKISGVSDPVSAQDAATKAYVDLLESTLALLEAEVEALQGVKDIDNNRYDIITIGTQTWMAENLATTRYNDGTVIPLITDGTSWYTAGNNGFPGYCWYEDESSNLIAYGALYNWYATDTLSNGDKNVCPTGWHMPTDDEWTTLTTYLGGTTVAGGKMKEAGLAHWNSPNVGATNESGFAALPGGHRHYLGAFYYIGSNGYWWSSTGYYLNPLNAWFRYLINSNGSVGNDAYNKGDGFSVRCLRDD